jgi:hypothetical protein
MRKTYSLLLTGCLLLGVSFDAPAAQAAKGKKSMATDTGISGSIASVDKTKKTITLRGRDGDKTVTVDSTTLITRDGKPAVFEDIKTGEVAAISTFTLADKLTAVSVKIGVATAKGDDGGARKKKKKNP